MKYKASSVLVLVRTDNSDHSKEYERQQGMSSGNLSHRPSHQGGNQDVNTASQSSRSKKDWFTENSWPGNNIEKSEKRESDWFRQNNWPATNTTCNLSETDMKERQAVAESVDKELSVRLAGCRVSLYGSSLAGFGLKFSTINLHLSITNQYKPHLALMTASEVLKNCRYY